MAQIVMHHSIEAHVQADYQLEKLPEDKRQCRKRLGRNQHQFEYALQKTSAILEIAEWNYVIEPKIKMDETVMS